MCGLAGWAGSVPASEADLARMTDALAHRGPDDQGALVEPGRVGLGFRRLSIIDLQTGNQPLRNEDGRVQATVNGEIYNFRELRRELEHRGHRFSTGSDCEVIVHLYEERGPDFAEALQGMFAVALWDRERERLVLCRDRLGVKPMYWAEAGGGIVYGSEPGAILASGQVPARPDPAAILDCLVLQYVPSPRTGFAGIHKLAPGERLVFENGAPAVSRYWDLDYSAKTGHRSPEEVVDTLDELLRDATRSRLISDVPLGAFLSGGIDSSLVVGYMAEAMSTVRTFSIDFAEAPFSEGAHARRVAAIYGTEHEEYRLEPEMLPVIAEAARHVGEPFADSSAIPTFLLSEVTRRHVTVALSGDGGDEAFAGYRRYVLARVGDAVDGLLPLRRPLERAREAAVPPGRVRDALRGLAALSRPSAERYAAVMSHFAPESLEALCDERFLAESGGANRPWTQTLSPDPLPGIDRYLALDTATYLPGDLLTKVDRMSMANSLEVRSPFLDYRVFEYAASLPPGLKLRRLQTKWPLKQLALRRGLPRDLVQRQKQGFGVPVGDWFRGELRGWLEEIVLDPSALGRGYFKPEAVRRLVADHGEGRADHGLRLWNLAMLELWHRSWIDGG